MAPPAPPSSLQALPPPAARFCLGVRRFLQDELGLHLRGQRFLAAFSGGADSTALLLCLHYLAPGAGFSLIAAHLDHALRPSSADEARACLALCARLGIEAVSERCDVAALAHADGTGIEEAARKARYTFLEERRSALACTLIAVGHTADDLAEDVIMRLVRGAGWPGLAGMRALDANRGLLRPLLLTPRKDVEAFLHSLELGWITDESNSDMRFFRNRVRARLLPLLLEENPSFLDAVGGLWRLGRLDEEYFAAALSQSRESVGRGSEAPDGQGATGHEQNASGGQRGSAPLETPQGAGWPLDPIMGAQGHHAPDGQRKTHALSGGTKELFWPRAALLAMPKALRLRLYKKALDDLGGGQAQLRGLLAADAALVAGGGPTEHRFAGKKRLLINSRGLTARLEP